jgi:predicted nucleic acid-binding protein
MDYLLDSDIINFLYDDQRRPEHQKIHQELSKLSNDDRLLTSVLVIYELEYSFYNAPEDKTPAIRNTNAIFNDFDAILPIVPSAAPIYEEIKANLKKDKNLSRKEMRKHNIDLMLASTAIDTSSVLVCGDKIYQYISKIHNDFVYENWLK